MSAKKMYANTSPLPTYLLCYGRISDWPVVICKSVVISVTLLWSLLINFRFSRYSDRKSLINYLLQYHSMYKLGI